MTLRCYFRLRCRSVNSIGRASSLAEMAAAVKVLFYYIWTIHSAIHIASCWNCLDPCGFNNSRCMLSPAGRSSTNADVPQRNQPSVATTSRSREWNYAQGEIFYVGFLIHTCPTLLISLRCELWCYSMAGYTGGYTLVLPPISISSALKWVSLKLRNLNFDIKSLISSGKIENKRSTIE